MFISRTNIESDKELNDMLRQLGLQPVSPKFAKSLFKKRKQVVNTEQLDDNITVNQTTEAEQPVEQVVEEVVPKKPRSRRSTRRKTTQSTKD